jgi:hypothetical protein
MAAIICAIPYQSIDNAYLIVVGHLRGTTLLGFGTPKSRFYAGF